MEKAIDRPSSENANSVGTFQPSLLVISVRKSSPLVVPNTQINWPFEFDATSESPSGLKTSSRGPPRIPEAILTISRRPCRS